MGTNPQEKKGREGHCRGTEQRLLSQRSVDTMTDQVKVNQQDRSLKG
jgi:hypothetical protein